MLGAHDAMTQSHTPKFSVDAEFSYTLRDDEKSIIPHLDAVAEHLIELGAEDVLLTVDHGARSIWASVVVSSYDAASIESVVGVAMGLFRTAFHASGGGTPGWPSTIREALTALSVTPLPSQGAESASERAQFVGADA